MTNIIDQLRAAWPPVVLGLAIDELSGGAICWRTVQNKRSDKIIPDKCFIRSGSRVLIVRDPFLDWWQTTLTDARGPDVPRPPRRESTQSEAA